MTTTIARLDTSAAQRSTQYSLRLNAFLRIEVEGKYTFYLNSDDGARVTVKGVEIASNERYGRGMQESDGSIELEEGYHEIEVLYSQLSEDAALTISYESGDAGIAKQEIPASALYLNSSPSATTRTFVRNIHPGLPVTLRCTNRRAFVRVPGRESYQLRILTPSGRTVEIISGTGPAAHTFDGAKLARGMYLMSLDVAGRKMVKSVFMNLQP
jgi:hypothetical protein